MKDQGLRIGNYISVHGHKIAIGTLNADSFSFTINGKTWNPYLPLDDPRVKGINLIDDLIERCMFVATQDGYFRQELGEIFISKPFSECGYHLVKTGSGSKLTSLKYLHQLQNFYHVITGQELIIDAYSPTERQQMKDKLDIALNE